MSHIVMAAVGSSATALARQSGGQWGREPVPRRSVTELGFRFVVINPLPQYVIGELKMQRTSCGFVLVVFFTLVGCGNPPTPVPWPYVWSRGQLGQTGEGGLRIGSSVDPPASALGSWTITDPDSGKQCDLSATNNDLVASGTGVVGHVVDLVLTRAGLNTTVWSGSVLVDASGNWTQTIPVTFADEGVTEWDLSLGQMNSTPTNAGITEYSRVRLRINYR